jgi:hypothetical protein
VRRLLESVHNSYISAVFALHSSGKHIETSHTIEHRFGRFGQEQGFAHGGCHVSNKMLAAHSYGRRPLSAMHQLPLVEGVGVEVQLASSSQNTAISAFAQSCSFIPLASRLAMHPIPDGYVHEPYSEFMAKVKFYVRLDWLPFGSLIGNRLF